MPFSTLSAMTANYQPEGVLARIPHERGHERGLASSREIQERCTCELCHAVPARDRAPNLTGHQLGRPVCRRCGAKARDFIFCAKGLEGVLLEQRHRRYRYVMAAPTSPHEAATRRKPAASGLPTEDRILRGLVTLNAAWLCSLAPAPAAAPVLPGFSRADLTGIYSSLRAYKRSRRMVEVLATDGALSALCYPDTVSSDRGTNSRSATEDATTTAAHTRAATTRATTLYTVGHNAQAEIEGLLGVCRTLRADAASLLGEHLTRALHYLSTAPGDRSGKFSSAI